MESILRVPLLQYHSEQSDVKIFSIREYETKFKKINDNLVDVYFNPYQKISMNTFIENKYDDLVDLIKFIIYSNLPFTSLNRDYNLKFTRITCKDNLLLDSIILKLHDIINVQLNIMIQVNKKDYINFILKKEDNDEILDIISRNYWFEKRELNIEKRFNLKKKIGKISYFE